ncbi:MAG: aldo/keto reductase [Nitrososphaerota archaeon]|nr:aldo/keto reductase [Nitrososphaerota archaeon]MDG6918245.1 aldo/keto reductase [Nitrososphaerota archaeon]
MNLKEFGKTGRKVSEIGMGTYYDPLWVMTAFGGWHRGAASKVGAIKAGLGAGITLVDTAEIYRSEPLVAKAMKGEKRDEVFLATKVWPSHLHRDDIVKSLDKSLARLETSYVDLYQVHFPNRKVPIRETMAAMEKLVEDGKIRHIGVSNFSLEQIKEAQSALPKSELSSVQLDYSLGHRDVERDTLPYCEQEKIALMAYYPLGHGKLPSDSRLDPFSYKYGKTRAQVALRWLADKANVFPIPRASKRTHVIDNAGAGGWRLSDQDVANLNLRFQ